MLPIQEHRDPYPVYLLNAVVVDGTLTGSTSADGHIPVESTHCYTLLKIMVDPYIF